MVQVWTAEKENLKNKFPNVFPKTAEKKKLTIFSAVHTCTIVLSSNVYFLLIALISKYKQGSGKTESKKLTQ